MKWPLWRRFTGSESGERGRRQAMCNALNKAIELGYLEKLVYYVDEDPESEALDWILTFPDKGDQDEDNPLPAVVVNYCPFCGNPFSEGRPTCGWKVGRETRVNRFVD
jgi:hypothetical protein